MEQHMLCLFDTLILWESLMICGWMDRWMDGLVSRLMNKYMLLT